MHEGGSNLVGVVIVVCILLITGISIRFLFFFNRNPARNDTGSESLPAPRTHHDNY